MNSRKIMFRLLAVLIAALVISAIAVYAQDDATDETPVTEEVVAETEGVEETVLLAETVQGNLDLTWMLLAGFLVFFMQAGFAMLEGGFIRQTGVVNSMAENFMDACVTGIFFFLIGYSFAYGGTSAFIGSPELALGGIDGTSPEHGATFIDFFFQFAFAGAAATIATGAMAERTNFIGKLIYSAIIAAFVYPVVVYWQWGGGWMFQAGVVDFAGSTVVHQTGGVIALIGAWFVGARPGRVFGEAPRPHNLAIATLGTFILWFGWYGFNVGSTLAASDMSQLGLVAVNTTLAACAGTMGAMFFNYFRTKNWDLSFILNGSLAGLVGITAGCSVVNPVGALSIGVLAGVLVVLVVNAVEAAKIDDAVGAFAVHGACGAFGTLAIGLFGVESLVKGYSEFTSGAGLLMGGGFGQLGAQFMGVAGVAIWCAVASVIMFGALKALGLLRINEAAETEGIDFHEHGAYAYVITAFEEE